MIKGKIIWNIEIYLIYIIIKEQKDFNLKIENEEWHQILPGENSCMP